MSQREFQTTKAALEKAEAAMRLHGWHLAHGSSDDGVAEDFAAWEAADKALHDGVPPFRTPLRGYAAVAEAMQIGREQTATLRRVLAERAADHQRTFGPVTSASSFKGDPV